MNLTEEQILALAPDEASRKSGKELSNPNKWVSKGISDTALWGEAQGSGSKPYQTQIDTNNIAFKCSCPSRKFPCKHGLGLLLFHARQPDLFALTDIPTWVTGWIEKRSTRDEKKTERADKPVDEAAQAKRLENREKKVADGIDELLLWIKDMVRNGIISLPEKGYAYWDQVAKRMVDAQAPGLANMVKSMGQVNFFAEGWQTQVMDQLLNLYLVVNGYKNRGQLPPLMQQEVKSLVGFTQKQDDLKEQPGVADTWLVLARQVSEEDNLTVERYWLHGATSGNYALVLQFLFQGQGATIALTPGISVQAEIVYYPATYPLRAIIKTQATGKAVPPAKRFANWQAVTAHETRVKASTPFYFQRPYVVEQVRPVRHRNQWWLTDRNNGLVAIPATFTNIWKMMAISGGQHLNIAVIGKETSYEPIGIWDNDTYKSL